MSGWKAGVAAAGAAWMFAMGGGTAWACDGPQLALGPSTAQPGDEVAFELACSEPGDDYKVTLEGEEVAAGTDEGDPGVSSSFTMPDLGDSEKTVTVEAAVTRGDGDPMVSQAEFGYRPRAEPAPDPPAAPGDKPAAPPAGASSAGSQATAPAAPAPSGSSPRAGTAPRAPDVLPGLRVRGTAVSGGSFVPRLSAREFRRLKTRRAAKRRKKARRRRARRARPALSDEARSRPPAAPREQERDRWLPLRYPIDVAWRLILGVVLTGLVLLSALQAVALARRKRRESALEGVDFGDLDAELHDLLAEDEADRGEPAIR